MSRQKLNTAHDLRNKLMRIIWAAARMVDVDPRQLAPQREGITGEEGGTLSACTLEELQQIAFQLKKAGGSRLRRVWVPAIPSGMRRLPTPYQVELLLKLLDRQKYLEHPYEFFRERLKVKDPNNPTFDEAKRMISYLTTKERTQQCA